MTHALIATIAVLLAIIALLSREIILRVRVYDKAMRNWANADIQTASDLDELIARLDDELKLVADESSAGTTHP